MSKLDAMRAEGCACENCRHWERDTVHALHGYHPCGCQGAGIEAPETRVVTKATYICPLWQQELREEGTTKGEAT